jgi:hypothetical protein
MLSLCGIVAAILKMATGRNFTMSGINSGHHNLLTYEMKENGGAKLGWGSQRYFLLQFFFLNIIPKKLCPNFPNRPLKINPFQNHFYPGFYIF